MSTIEELIKHAVISFLCDVEKLCKDNVPTISNTTILAMSGNVTPQKFVYDDTLLYRCTKGHILSDGSNRTDYIITCNASGLWDQAPDSCERKSQFP